MPAEQAYASLVELRASSREDVPQHLRVELARKSDEVERRERPAAHRVDVGQRVGRGDLAEAPRVVDNRGEEVDRLEQEPIAEGHVAGVIVAVDAARVAVGVRGGEAAENLLEVGGREL